MRCRWRGCWLVLGGLLLTMATPISAQKLQQVPGFLFAQLTDNSANDWLPRVSGRSLVGPSLELVTWTGAHQLPTATSTLTTDLEVFLWDGQVLEQVTDDDVNSTRPVVNNLREIAFETGGNGVGNDLSVRTGSECWRVTADSNRDRYPDINDNGIVVWGHYNDNTQNFGFSSYDLRRRAWFNFPFIYSYRPHINAANQVEVSAAWLRLPDSTLLELGPKPADYGYDNFRRGELNDLGWILIEADPNPALQNAHDQGPRDMLLWNGSTMKLIYSSPVEWAGRGDLNRRGVLAWEGRGGLPGSTSGTADTEIFVYDPSRAVVEQITDDDVEDNWPTVMDNDTIVWVGQGSYAGSQSSSSDFEIFLACPDRDGDGVGDTTSLCATAPGSQQIQVASSFVSVSAKDCQSTLLLRKCGLGFEVAPPLLLLWVCRRRSSARRRRHGSGYGASGSIRS